MIKKFTSPTAAVAEAHNIGARNYSEDMTCEFSTIKVINTRSGCVIALDDFVMEDTYNIDRDSMQWNDIPAEHIVWEGELLNI